MPNGVLPVSRATDLAKLPRWRVVEVFTATMPAADGRLIRQAVQVATKEQLVAAIVAEEERCQSPPPK